MFLDPLGAGGGIMVMIANETRRVAVKLSTISIENEEIDIC